MSIVQGPQSLNFNNDAVIDNYIRLVIPDLDAVVYITVIRCRCITPKPDFRNSCASAFS